MVTTKVFGTIMRQTGQPDANVPISIQLTVTETDTESDVVVPSERIVVNTDDVGYFEVELWPNSRGVNGSQYQVRLANNTWSALITVPEVESVDITDIISQAPYPSVDAAQAAIESAQLSAAQAGVSADAAAESAAATSADVIATNEDREQTGLDVVATAADREQTGLDRFATGEDRVQTGLDVVATAADREQTALDVQATANSADAAELSETNAASSESNASTSEGNALASELKAEKWSEELEDVAVGVGKYSALHHAAKASASASSSSISASTATAQAEIATTKSGEAFTSASNADDSAIAAASSAVTAIAAAEQTGLDVQSSANSASAADISAGLAADAQTAAETAQGAAETARDQAQSAVADHADRDDNPHGVTAAQVGLGNVDNTSDADKPVSVPQQAALDKKVDIPSLVIYQLGQPGELGFGCATAYPAQYQAAGCVPMLGHNDLASANYGNYLHLASGAILVFIPKHYFKIDGNTFSYSDVPATGYVIDRSFINAGAEIDGVFVSKYGGTNNAGVFSSQAGLDPLSTSSDHNPISQLNGTPANRYGGLYAAVKTMSDDAVLTPIFVYSMLARMAKAHGNAASSTSVCAYIDVDPKMPKGNLISALRDVNDSSVTFTGSGYSSCALTGSGTPFAKTTHNGQACGIADLNGNMWEVASGFIRYDATGFLILKESTDLTAIASDSTTMSGGGAYDRDLYDVIDISDLISANDGWIDLGNGTNQVFDFSETRTDAAYKRTALGIPLSDGVSSSGTTEFGNDGVYRYLRNEMACRCGGYWGHSSNAGVFAMVLIYSRTNSYYDVGGRASILV